MTAGLQHQETAGGYRGPNLLGGMCTHILATALPPDPRRLTLDRGSNGYEEHTYPANQRLGFQMVLYGFSSAT